MTQVFIISENEERRERLAELARPMQSTSIIDRLDIAPAMMKEVDPAVVVIDGVMNGDKALACAHEMQAGGKQAAMVVCVPDEPAAGMERDLAALKNVYMMRESNIERELPIVIGAISGQKAGAGNSASQPESRMSVYQRLQNESDEVTKN